MLKKETGYIDKETGKNETRYAWFTLKGSHLKFSDWASEDEIEKGRKLLAKRGIEMASMKIKSTSPFGKKFKATSALDTKPKKRERAIAATAEEYDALIEGIKSAAKTVFPNGWCMAEARKYIGQLNISVRGGIIGDMSELTQRIPDNDPAYFHFLVRPVKEGYEIEHLVGFGVKVKPTTQGYAMGVHKVKLRKTKGDAAKIIETFKKHMQKLKKAVQEQNENVYQREKYSDKFFK